MTKQDTFSLTPLANHRVLVEGEDRHGNSHSVILNGREYDEIAAMENVLHAGQAFDQAVEDFFAPLTDAAAVYEDAAAPVVDPAFIYVVEEGSAGEPSVEREVLGLEHDTAVLRLINTGDTERLLWITVGGQSLIEVTEYNPVLQDDPEIPGVEDALTLFETEPLD